MMQRQAPHVYEWVKRMNNPAPLTGHFLPEDKIPPTLLPILKIMCRDHFPDILGVIEKNRLWVDQNPESDLPRILGMHPFRYGSARGERQIHSYAQWMFQRPYEHYHSLKEDHKADADELLRLVGGYEALNTSLKYKLSRTPGQLELTKSCEYA